MLQAVLFDLDDTLLDNDMDVFLPRALGTEHAPEATLPGLAEGSLHDLDRFLRGSR